MKYSFSYDNPNHNVMIMTMTTMIAITNHISKRSGQVAAFRWVFQDSREKLGRLSLAQMLGARGLCFSEKSDNWLVRKWGFFIQKVSNSATIVIGKADNL